MAINMLVVKLNILPPSSVLDITELYVTDSAIFWAMMLSINLSRYSNREIGQ
jgi:hypothetical protein